MVNLVWLHFLKTVLCDIIIIIPDRGEEMGHSRDGDNDGGGPGDGVLWCFPVGTMGDDA